MLRSVLQRAGGILTGRLVSAQAADGSYAFVLGMNDDQIENIALNDHVFLYQTDINLDNVDYIKASMIGLGPLTSSPNISERHHIDNVYPGNLLTLWQFDEWTTGSPPTNTPGIGSEPHTAIHNNKTGFTTRVWVPSTNRWLGKAPKIAHPIAPIFNFDGMEVQNPGGGEYDLLNANAEKLQIDAWIEVESWAVYDTSKVRTIVAHGNGYAGGVTKPSWSLLFDADTGTGGIQFTLTDGGGVEETYGPVTSGWSKGGGYFHLSVQVGAKDATNATRIYIDGVKKWEGTRTKNAKGFSGKLRLGGSWDGAALYTNTIGLGTNLWELRILDALRSADHIAWCSAGRDRETQWCVEMYVDDDPRARRWLRTDRVQTIEDLKIFTAKDTGTHKISFALRLARKDEDPDQIRQNFIV